MAGETPVVADIEASIPAEGMMVDVTEQHESPDRRQASEPDLSWTLLDTQVAYQGFLLIQSRRYRLPDGRVTRWDVLAGSANVSVLALTTAGTVVVARQFRPGPGRVLAEMPGGIVDPGEDPGAAGARELLEETGYRATLVEVIGGTWMSGFSTIYRHIVLATGCVKVGSPAGGGDEFCQPAELTASQFVDLLRAGALTDSDAGYRAADHLGWLR